MSYYKNLQKLNTFSYFNTTTLQNITQTSKKNLYDNIQRWVRDGRIIQLKKGMYVNSAYYDTLNNKQYYIEFIANKLKTPSYISLEYVLQKYSILSESVFALTCVTLKKPNIYKNKLGVFSYSHIKESLFCGYENITKGEFKIYEATKAKALFDYLYFKFFRIKQVHKDQLLSLRLNLDEYTQDDFREFKLYAQKSKLNKLMKVYDMLYDI